MSSNEEDYSVNPPRFSFQVPFITTLPTSLSVREEQLARIAGEVGLSSLFEGKTMQNLHPINQVRQPRVVNRPLSNAEAFALFVMGIGFISSLALVMIYTLFGSNVA